MYHPEGVFLVFHSATSDHEASQKFVHGMKDLETRSMPSSNPLEASHSA
jgi:hypothetical protein